MANLEEIISAIIGIYIIGIFLTAVLPALAQSTGSNTSIVALGIVLLIIGFIASLFRR